MDERKQNDYLEREPDLAAPESNYVFFFMNQILRE